MSRPPTAPPVARRPTQWPFALLAPLLGYLATWFVWGVPVWVLPMLWLGGAALWTLAPRRGVGGWTFARSFFAVLLVGLAVWVVGAMWVGLQLVAHPSNPLPFSWWGLLPLLLLGGAIIAAALALVSQIGTRARRERGQVVLIPWLWLLGGLTFAAFPAVRVDCRGLNADSFLSSSSGFGGVAGTNYWGRYPQRITGRSQLPADLGGLDVSAGAAFCTRDAAGRSRIFSLRASQPQILVQLSEYGGARRNFHALFSLGEHRQLTPWKAGKWVSLAPANIINYLAWRGVPVVSEWPKGVPQPAGMGAD